MMGKELSKEDVIGLIKASEHNKVKVGVADIDGVIRGKLMHREKFLSAVKNGFGFCDVVLGWDCADECYDNVKQTGWHSGYPDAEVKVDLTTFRRVPWDDGVPFFLADFDGRPGCPRSVLKNVLQRAKDAGFETLVGCEYEWFNFEETPESFADKGHRDPTPLTPGMFGYSLLRPSLYQDYYNSIFDLMDAFDVPIEGLHTETGPGVYEVAIRAADAMEAADRAILFKTSVKQIAYEHGVLASFMPRWNTTLPGCSGHIHQSLWRDGKNVFSDPSQEHKMSDLFRSYIAGQLKCLPEILPMFAPTINSYKRLVEGYWAPTKCTWGVDNRTVALRVITGKSPRLETRVPGSDVNAYLGIAAAIASGLYGVMNNLTLDSPAVIGNGYEADAVRLPKDLERAATKMRESELAEELFGSDFVDHFTSTRLWEAREYAKAVTDWEMKRYFEII